MEQLDVHAKGMAQLDVCVRAWHSWVCAQGHGTAGSVCKGMAQLDVCARAWHSWRDTQRAWHSWRDTQGHCRGGRQGKVGQTRPNLTRNSRDPILHHSAVQSPGAGQALLTIWDSGAKP